MNHHLSHHLNRTDSEDSDENFWWPLRYDSFFKVVKVFLEQLLILTIVLNILKVSWDLNSLFNFYVRFMNFCFSIHNLVNIGHQL